MKVPAAVLMFLVCATLPPDAAAQSQMGDAVIYLVINLQRNANGDLDSSCTCWYERAGEPQTGVHYDYRHWIHRHDNVGVVLSDSGQVHVESARVAEDREVGTGFPGTCYRSRMKCSGNSSNYYVLENEVGSSRVCLASSPPPSKTCTEPLADGSCPPTGPTCTEYDEFCDLSPIVIDVAGHGYQLSGLDDPVLFDLDADGRPEFTGWIGRGSGLAFLALDRNGNARIDDGAELFGDATPLGATKARNGFEALAQYDENGDDVIDARDSIWRRLLLWNDLDHDGVSEINELSAITATAIDQLGLDYRWTGRRDRSGNTLRYAGRASTGLRSRLYYDIFFVVRH